MQTLVPEQVCQLAREFAAGNELAYRQLFDLLYGRLIVFGSTLTPQRDLVEDQVQELFVWIHRNRRRLPALERPDLYFFVSLRHNIVKALRRQSNRNEADRRYDASQRRGSVPDEGGEMDFREDSLCVVINELPSRMRQVIFLRYYECYSYDQIAAIMEVKPQTARNFAARALKLLRRTASPSLGKLYVFCAVNAGAIFF